MIFTQAPKVLIFLVIKNIFLNYILTRSRLVTIFFFRASPINLVLFYLRLGSEIFLRSSLPFSQSFNILANEIFNQNNTLCLQLIRISRDSPSTVLHMWKMAKGGTEMYIFRTFFGWMKRRGKILIGLCQINLLLVNQQLWMKCRCDKPFDKRFSYENQFLLWKSISIMKISFYLSYPTSTQWHIILGWNSLCINYSNPGYISITWVAIEFICLIKCLEIRVSTLKMTLLKI